MPRFAPRLHNPLAEGFRLPWGTEERKTLPTTRTVFGGDMLLLRKFEELALKVLDGREARKLYLIVMDHFSY